MSDKKEGALRKAASAGRWLVAPRFFASAETMQKYGLFAQIKKLFNEVKEAATLSKDGQKIEFDINNASQRRLYFYDRAYESKLFGGAINNLHRRSYLSFKYMMALAGAIFVLSVFALLYLKISVLPSWVFFLPILTISISVAIRALSHAYLAWLVEQRLIPEVFSFRHYLLKAGLFERFPKSHLTDSHRLEIQREENERVNLIIGKIKSGRVVSAESMGLTFPPGVDVDALIQNASMQGERE